MYIDISPLYIGIFMLGALKIMHGMHKWTRISIFPIPKFENQMSPNEIKSWRNQEKQKYFFPQLAIYIWNSLS